MKSHDQSSRYPVRREREQWNFGLSRGLKPHDLDCGRSHSGEKWMAENDYDTSTNDLDHSVFAYDDTHMEFETLDSKIENRIVKILAQEFLAGDRSAGQKTVQRNVLCLQATR